MTTCMQLQRAHCRVCKTTTIHAGERCMYCQTALPVAGSSGVREREFNRQQRTGRRGARATNGRTR